jgi:hypothetical protein
MRSLFGSKRGLTRPAIIRRPNTIDTMAPHQIAGAAAATWIRSAPQSVASCRAAAVPILFDADAPEHAIWLNAAEAMPFDKECAQESKEAVAGRAVDKQPSGLPLLAATMRMSHGLSIDATRPVRQSMRDALG